MISAIILAISLQCFSGSVCNICNSYIPRPDETESGNSKGRSMYPDLFITGVVLCAKDELQTTPSTLR